MSKQLIPEGSRQTQWLLQQQGEQSVAALKICVSSPASDHAVEHISVLWVL